MPLTRENESQDDWEMDGPILGVYNPEYDTGYDTGYEERFS
jgi:hypothetical protein